MQPDSGGGTSRKVALFGATGSIGRQALDVIGRLGGFSVSVLTAASRVEELARLARRWRPEWVVIADEHSYPRLKEALEGTGIRIRAGAEAAAEAASGADYDICLNGIVGVAGLLPSYHALQRGIDLALANKESLVLAGELLNRTARLSGARIIPVDSEHSAVLQCLQGEELEDVERLILTASGGPFRSLPLDQLRNATPQQALRHPTWKMGPKITVDSATLMNKGLEVIEAFHLFGIPPERIQVVIHPQSIVHSMVRFSDGSIKAQLGTPDMRLPIQYALTFPGRAPLGLMDDDPTAWQSLEFHPVEAERYPCLGLAYRALDMGGTATAVLNGADEEAVRQFLEGEIRFGDIPEAIAAVLDGCKPVAADDIDVIVEADRMGRDAVAGFVRDRFQAASKG